MSRIRREFLVTFDTDDGVPEHSCVSKSLEVLMAKYAHKAVILSDVVVDMEKFENEVFQDSPEEQEFLAQLDRMEKEI